MSAVAPIRLPFLQRRYAPRVKPVRGMIGFAPLSDITLLIVLFLLMQSSLVLKPGIHLDLPTAGFSAGAPWNAAILRVTQEGHYFFEDQRVPRAALYERLTQSRDRQAVDTLLIEADRRVAYDRIIELHDLARKAGFADVVLATRQDDTLWSPVP
jgi:biopolymer transport protein ExbD